MGSWSSECQCKERGFVGISLKVVSIIWGSPVWGPSHLRRILAVGRLMLFSPAFYLLNHGNRYLSRIHKLPFQTPRKHQQRQNLLNSSFGLMSSVPGLPPQTKGAPEAIRLCVWAPIPEMQRPCCQSQTPASFPDERIWGQGKQESTSSPDRHSLTHPLR